MKNRKKFLGVCLGLILIIVCIVGYDEIAFQVSLNKAFYYSEREEYDLEVNEYNKMIQQKPELYELYVNKAIALVNCGEIEEAILVFNQAEQMNSNDPELYYNMAHLYELIGDDNAYQYYTELGRTLEFQQNVEEN